MNMCNLCEEEISEDGVKCMGCQNMYHFGSCSISEKTHRAKSRDAKSKWRCIKCRENESVQGRSSTSHPRNEERNLENDLLNLDHDMSPSMKKLIQELIKSVQHMSEKFDEMAKKLDENIKENKLLKQEVNILKGNMSKKDTEIANLSLKLHKIEQYKKRKYVEIHGLKTADDASPMEEYREIAKKIGADEECEATQAEIIPMKSNKILVVKFKEENQRNVFRKKGIQWWNNMNREQKLNEDRLYFNEALTQENRNLLKELRIQARLKNIKYVWVKNGTILVRKEDNGKVIAATSVKDLDKC